DMFHHMRQRRQLVKAEGATAPFDRMGGAKEGVDDLLLYRLLGQTQQATLHRFQPFEALLEKYRQELPDVDRHALYSRTFLIVAKSWSGLKGLTIQPVAPAAFPACFFSGADSVVSSRMGVNL